MKKTMFFALCALMTFGLVSCKDDKGGNPTTDVTIKIEPATLDLSIGDTERLRAVVTPAEAEVTLTWSSSNEEVAKVSQSGVVEAVGYGEATITASAEGAKENGTCVVKISERAMYDNFTFSNYSIFGAQDPVIEGYEDPIELELSDGSTIQAKLERFFVMLYGDGIYYVDGQGLTGKGLLAQSEIAMYRPVDEANTYIGSGAGFLIDVNKDEEGNIRPYVIQPGKFLDKDKYGQFMEKQTTLDENGYPSTTEEDFKNLYWPSMEGFYLQNQDIDNNTATLVDAVIPSGRFDQDANGRIMYDIQIQWFNNMLSENRFFGLLIEPIDEQNFKIVKPYNMELLDYDYTYGELPPLDEPAQVQARDGKSTYFLVRDEEHVHLDVVCKVNEDGRIVLEH